MPRDLNPKDIKTGPGQTVPEGPVPSLVDGGYVGPRPIDIGGGAGLVLEALKAHINDPKGAHLASAIELTPIPPLNSDNVETALQDVVGGMPPEPPKLGQYFRSMDFHCIPDWGAAKLGDLSNHLRDTDFTGLVRNFGPDKVFPYFHTYPNPTAVVPPEGLPSGGLEYTPGTYPVYPVNTPVFDGSLVNSKNRTIRNCLLFPAGSDPCADRLFNNPLLFLGLIPNPPAGPGRCFAGGFTRVSDNHVQRSLRLMSWDSGPAWPPVVTISGSIYPADRGVLALLHIPPTQQEGQGIMDDFISGQTLLERCPAAILLGQGILGDVCIGPVNQSIGSTEKACDGDPGGIFGLGMALDGSYDPYVFPGRATGQYNLDELHTGVSVINGSVALNPPWNDLDHDGVPGAQRRRTAGWVPGDPDPYPAPGQVRLGTDPNSGVAVEEWGIPILGASTDAYGSSAAMGAIYDPSIKRYGKSVVHDLNFFKFRLPYLDDYSADMGLKYTPKGVVPSDTFETRRYLFSPAFLQPTENPQTWSMTPEANLATAGNYPPFTQDCITWQLARFRHTFTMDGNFNSAPIGSPPTASLGTYVLIHFKTEKDFEAMVRDGIVPNEVYGMHFVTSSSNVVNEHTDVTDAAPDYGFAAEFFNGIREEVFIGGQTADHILDAGDIALSEFSWTYRPDVTPGNTGMMCISGVWYYTPLKRLNEAGNPYQSFRFTGFGASINNAWRGCYRTADPQLTPPGVPPALINSPDPAFMSLQTFWNARSSTFPLPIGYVYNEGRIELDLEDLGFSWNVGPTAGSPLDFLMVAPDVIDPQGDIDYPSFSTNAKPWFYVRRPLTHGSTWENVTQPAYTVTDGHGFSLASDEGSQILFHSTDFHADTDGAGGVGSSPYGNFVLTNAPINYPGPPIVVCYPAYDCLFTALKDTEERFLDEVYRFRSLVIPVPSGHPLRFAYLCLAGPGMGTWVGGFIPVPVQAGMYHYAASFPPPYDTLYGTDVEAVNVGSFTQRLIHLNLPKGELQVCGLPARNPPILDWAKYPFPSSGLLRFSSVDYSVGYRPDLASDGVLQPDYSALYALPKSYVRIFDTAFSRFDPSDPTPPVTTAGQPFVTLRIDGIKLEDFRYSAPGPGTLQNLTAPKIAIFAKVPGLTTWMDMGRADGAGPSKQHPTQDGAGCQVIGPYTFDGIDPETGLVYCQIYINAGPYINLETGLASTGGRYEVPLMVKVMMNSMIVGEYDLTGTGPGNSGADVRGLVGIKIVHPTQRETAPV